MPRKACEYTAASLAAAVALGVLTHLRNEEYRSRAAVWTQAMERMPESVRARANLAQGLLINHTARASSRAVLVAAQSVATSEATRSTAATNPPARSVPYNAPDAVRRVGTLKEIVRFYREAKGL